MDVSSSLGMEEEKGWIQAGSELHRAAPKAQETKTALSFLGGYLTLEERPLKGPYLGGEIWAREDYLL